MKTNLLLITLFICSFGFAQTTLKINEIQYTTSNLSSYENVVVQTSGIVTGIASNGYWIQDCTGAWSGIFIFDSNNTVTLGDNITVIGEVIEFSTFTEIANLTSFTLNSSGNQLPNPMIITSSMVNQEKYESVLVQVKDAICVNDDTGFGEWQINDGSGVCLVDDLMYGYNPVIGSGYKLTGICYFSYGNYKIEPRVNTDVVEIVDAFEPNNTFTEAISINSCTTYGGTIGNTLDIDYFSFNAIGGQNTDIMLFNVSNSLSFFEFSILDSSFNQILNDTSSNAVRILNFTANTNGLYYLEVKDSQGNVSSQEYKLVIVDGGCLDTDGDGLIDSEEINIYGTDNFDADSDNDGLTDAIEVFSNTDPLDADTDDDGLSDGAEILTTLTNPLFFDTDCDGLPDGTEYGISNPLPDTDTNIGNFIADADLGVTITNPNNPDTDGDNLFDGAEDSNHDGETIYTLGFTGTIGSGETDPNSADTDGDALMDGAEVNIYGSDPLDVDTDDGGVSDGDEVNNFGSDPLDPNDDDSDGDGFTITAGDCDDNDATIYPGALEFCDGNDNNCDGNVDENAVDATIYYADNDGDGYGDDNNTIQACSPPVNYITVSGDCDDNDATIYPGATDIPNNGIDENCDGQDATASIEDELFSKNLSIYPNPTKNKITIKIDRPSNYKIFNIGGQLIKKGNLLIGENSLDVFNFSNGVYFIKINSNSNNAILKMIKN